MFSNYEIFWKNDIYDSIIETGWSDAAYLWVNISYTYLKIIWNKETVVEIHGWSYHFTTPCVSPIGVGRVGSIFKYFVLRCLLI